MYILYEHIRICCGCDVFVVYDVMEPNSTLFALTLQLVSI